MKSDTLDHDQKRRARLRWVIILALNNARPIGAPEGLVRTCAEGEIPDVTEMELRCELDFLAGMGYVQLRQLPDGKWIAALLPKGVSLREYTLECPPDIARPAKYW